MPTRVFKMAEFVRFAAKGADRGRPKGRCSSYTHVMRFELTVLIEEGEDGWWIAEIPQISGALSQGRTPEEARESVLDAAETLMDYRREQAEKEHPNARRDVILLAA